MRSTVCCTLGLGALATFLLALGSSSLAQDSHLSALSDFLDHPDRPIYVRGDYFKAIQVAYGDFVKVLARRRVKTSGAPDQDSSEYPMRMSRIEYYDIYIEESGDAYRIHIAPTRREPLHEIFGGGATYVIDRVSFKIINITMSK
jgi:hypothetical protein